ncbi:MAG: bifunctional DNA-formamidopyrimidine glycosylase/DNA-(apurinic or apyrimidinic site) lyase [Acidobacteriota bacterium]
MPELPEVETIRRGLEAHLPGRRIVGVKVRETRLRRLLDAARLREVALGRRVRAVRRRAKYLILDLEDQFHLLVHLGMTGQFFLARPERPAVPHEHVVFSLDNGRTLRFADTRRFGLLEPLGPGPIEAHPLLSGLGPEPLDGELDPRAFRQATRRLRKPIKNFLLDSRAVAGVGNIYACECLFRAGIHPATPLRRLDGERWRSLLGALRRVLRQAIRRGGTTLQDFVNAEGEAGYFQMRLRVYDREGKACPACRSPIRRIVLAGRSTYFCPRCQPRRQAPVARHAARHRGSRTRPPRKLG